MRYEERKKWFLDLVVVALVGGLVVFAFSYGMALWDPWESSVVMTAQRISQANLSEDAFWVPQFAGHLVFRPLLELWSLAAVLHINSDAPAWLLRLPSGLLGLWLAFVSFVTMRKLFSRKSAYFSLIALLTLPMFVLSAKVLHGGIWTLAALALPLMHFIWMINVQSLRRLHFYQSIFGLSLLFAFLAGGIFALACIALILLSFIAFDTKEQRLSAFCSKFFVVPACISLALILLTFNAYQSHIRYTLEYRIPVPLLTLNQSIEKGGLKSIAMRRDQIIGEFNEKGNIPTRNQRFVLSRDSERLLTDSRLIFSENEVEARRFYEHMKVRFAGQSLPEQTTTKPSRDGAFLATLRFFSFNALDPSNHLKQQTAKIVSGPISFPYNAIFAYPLTKDEINTQSPQSDISQSPVLGLLQAGQSIVINDQNTDSSDFIRVEAGKLHGFVLKRSIVIQETETKLEFKRWTRILQFGLFPWLALLPLIFAVCFAPARLLDGAKLHETKEIRRIQRFLALWIFWGFGILLLSLSYNNHFLLMATIPFAMACGLICASPQFMKDIFKRPWLRVSMAITMCALLIQSLHDIAQQPFRLLEYLLRDPLMKWRESAPEYTPIVLAMGIFFVVIVLLSCFGAFSAIVKKIHKNRPNPLGSFLDEAPEERAEFTPSSEMPTPRMPRAIQLIWQYSLRLLLLPLWHGLRFLRSPAKALCLTACIFSVFCHGLLLPKSSAELSDDWLIEQYHRYAVNSAQIYRLDSASSHPCETYADCSLGYTCSHNKCSLPSLGTYSLRMAKKINEEQLIGLLKQQHKLFVLIPNDEFVRWNQLYRALQFPAARRNLSAFNDTSSRLVLAANFSAPAQDFNPINKILKSTTIGIPNLPPSTLLFGNGLQCVGHTVEQDKNTLKVNVFLKVWKPIKENFQSFLTLNSANNITMKHHTPLSPLLPTKLWLIEDVVIDSYEIPITPEMAGTQYQLKYGLFLAQDYIPLTETPDAQNNDITLQDLVLHYNPLHDTTQWWKPWNL